MTRSLRRAALATDKSQKQASKNGSPRSSSKSNSPKNGRTHENESQTGSPMFSGSDTDFSDYEASIANSDDLMDGFLASPPSGLVDEVDHTILNWETKLEVYIEQIEDRKTHSRKDCLAGFLVIMASHFSIDIVSGRTDGLLKALHRLSRTSNTDIEKVLALQAMSILIITNPQDTQFDMVNQGLKEEIEDGLSLSVKAAAIHTLGVVTFYGGSSLQETEAVMDFFLDIVDTDGTSVDALDCSAVVTAAIEEWCFLFTQLEDAKVVGIRSIGRFVHQLDSGDVPTLVAAGKAIALIYQDAYDNRHADESDDSEYDDWGDELGVLQRNGAPAQTYDKPWGQHERLLSTLKMIIRDNAHHLSKKNKRMRRFEMRDIYNSVENPSRGPRYRTSLHPDSFAEYGSALFLKTEKSQDRGMVIKTWIQFVRYESLKRILRGGFLNHWTTNGTVQDTLPYVGVEESGGDKSPRSGKGKGKGRK